MKKVTGECTPGCGACCRVLALPDPRFTVEGLPTGWTKSLLDQGLVPPVHATKERAFKYLAVRGVTPNGTVALRIPISPSPRGPNWWIAEYNGQRYVFFRNICPNLDPAGMCRIHEDTGAYPETCREFPTALDDLRLFPECTYEIVDAPVTEEE